MILSRELRGTVAIFYLNIRGFMNRTVLCEEAGEQIRGNARRGERPRAGVRGLKFKFRAFPHLQSHFTNLHVSRSHLWPQSVHLFEVGITVPTLSWVIKIK